MLVLKYLRVLFLFCLVVISVRAQCSYIDDSVNLFFPKALSQIQYSQTEFSIFWWNFTIIDPKNDGQADFSKAKEVCEFLRSRQNQELKLIVCGDNDLLSFKPLLVDWAKDIIKRQSFPQEQVNQQQWLRRSRLAVSQLAMVSDRNLMELLRIDPFGSWQDLVDKNRNITESRFKRNQGFLLDEESQRIVIPIQFQVPPKMSATENLFKKMNLNSQVHMVGNHRAAYLNESIVHEDMEKVSWIGILSLFLFMAFLVFKKRKAAVFLVIPISIGMLGASLVTIFFYKSIHGLTLAFGSGIAGLALDYALHGAFNHQSKQTWISNSIGLLTTLMGLGTLLFCRIPLIEQMMFFSIVGIIFGFIISYCMCEYFPKYFHLEGLSFNIPAKTRYSLFLILILVCGWVGIFNIHFDMDLRRFNYELPEEKKITEWFYKYEISKPTYIFIKPLTSGLIEYTPEFHWSQRRGAEFEGVLKYIPASDEQLRNLTSWQKIACPYFTKQWSAEEKKIFQNFLDSICVKTDNASLIPNDRAYLSSYIGTAQSVSLIRTANLKDDLEFRKEFPEVRSIADSLMAFSDILRQDLKWMLVVSVALALLMLFLYYRRLILVFTGVLPFITGVGCFFIVAGIFGETVDLISVLGLLMVFGFSIDYGVFATDLYQKNSGFIKLMSLGQLENSVFSTITIAAVTNLIGFMPMLFARHVVLHQLGYALFFGTLGTYIGAIWGVPFFVKGKKFEKTANVS